MPRTRFQRGDQPDSDCTPGSDFNKPLLAAQTGGNETVSATVPAQTMNSLEGSFSMAVGDPGGEDLPAGSLFRCQLDVTVAGANLVYRVQFHALDAACTSLGSVAMAEADFSGIGLKLATAVWDPPAGANRYQAHIIVTNSAGHTGPTETLTLRTNNANAFYEIPNAPVTLIVGGEIYPVEQIPLPPGFSAQEADPWHGFLPPAPPVVPDIGWPAAGEEFPVLRPHAREEADPWHGFLPPAPPVVPDIGWPAAGEEFPVLRPHAREEADPWHGFLPPAPPVVPDIGWPATGEDFPGRMGLPFHRTSIEAEEWISPPIIPAFVTEPMDTIAGRFPGSLASLFELDDFTGVPIVPPPAAAEGRSARLGFSFPAFR